MKLVNISVMPPSNAGGAEVVYENLKNKKVNFKNFSFKDLPKKYDKYSNLFHIKEIIVSKYLLNKALKEKPDILIYDKIFGWPKIKTSAKKICYSHGSYTLAGLQFKKKSFFMYLFYKFILKYFEKKSYKDADKIICVSENSKNELLNYFKIEEKKIKVINNGVDLKKFKEINKKNLLKKKYNLPEKRKILFFPGRPSYGKGFDIAEKALEILGKDYLILVLGEGVSTQNIIFLNKIPNDKMSEIYSLSDLVIFPSRYEGNSISVLESAACKCPLVLSKVGLMVTEKIPEKYLGKNPEDYANKIKSLLNNKKELNEAKKFWFNFVQKYPLEKQVKELNMFLKNLK